MIYSYLEKLIPVFKPMPLEQPPNSLLGFAWHYIKEAKGVFLFVLINSVFLALAESYIVVMVGEFVDLLSNNTPSTLWQKHYYTLMFMLIFIVFLKPLITFLDESVINLSIIPAFSNFVRWHNYLWVSQQSIAFFNNDFAGRLANRVVQGGQALRSATTKLINDLWFVVIYAVSVLAVFISHSFVLALPVIGWIVGYALLLKWFIPRANATQEVASKLKSTVMGRMVDEFTNILTVKLFANEMNEHAGVRAVIEKQTNANNAAMRVNTTMATGLSLLNAVFLATTGVICYYLWVDGRATGGSIAAMLTFATRLAHISGWVMHTLRDLFENIGALRDSLDTVSQPLTLTDKIDAKPLVLASSEITFKNVSFHYGKGEGVLEGLNLTIKQGERVGVVGASGVGKTTLMNLALRLYDVEKGEIFIGGQNIAEVTQSSLRENIGVVTQEPSLFHRSIFENIAFGKPSATQKEVELAANRAKAHEFILALKDSEGRVGYDAHIGERGVKLSGGQRQRIAIARVLLKNAPILLLDEATSALDSEIEAAIQGQLQELMHGKTVLAIAHRLSTIASLDRLIVIEGGKVMEDGSHAALLALNGVYAKLWKRQSGGFLGDL